MSDAVTPLVGPNTRTYLEFEEALRTDSEEALMGCLESWLVFTANQNRVKIDSVSRRVMGLNAYHRHFVAVKKAVLDGNFEQTRRFLAEVAFYLCREHGVEGAERYLNPMILPEAVRVLRNLDRPQRAKVDPATREKREAERAARRAIRSAGPRGPSPAPDKGRQGKSKAKKA